MPTKPHDPFEVHPWTGGLCPSHGAYPELGCVSCPPVDHPAHQAEAERAARHRASVAAGAADRPDAPTLVFADDDADTIRCPDCDGLGSHTYASLTVLCSTCNGTGTVTATPPTEPRRTDRGDPVTIPDAARDAAVKAWEAHAGLSWETGAGKAVRQTVDVILAAAAPHMEAPLRARIEALAEEWRYKGEFGWGPWQVGEGPDETSGPAMSDQVDLDRLCEVMHDAYETAAAVQGWETQVASRKPWADVPEANKATMRVAVAALVVEAGRVHPLRARIEALANYWEATPSQRLSGWLIAHDLRAARDDTADTTRSET